MAEPFVAEIRMMSFGYAPRGWAMCNGQLLPINQNQALFSLLGTTFGGDGRVNFALPDLRGQVPIHVGSGHTLGEKGGAQAVTVSVSQLPLHIHTVNATNNAATTDDASNNVFAQAGLNAYAASAGAVAMGAAMVGNAGGSQAHLNMQPFLVINFSIALQGIFPSPN